MTTREQSTELSAGINIFWFPNKDQMVLEMQSSCKRNRIIINKYKKIILFITTSHKCKTRKFTTDLETQTKNAKIKNHKLLLPNVVFIQQTEDQTWKSFTILVSSLSEKLPARRSYYVLLFIPFLPLTECRPSVTVLVKINTTRVGRTGRTKSQRREES